MLGQNWPQRVRVAPQNMDIRRWKVWTMEPSKNPLDLELNCEIFDDGANRLSPTLPHSKSMGERRPTLPGLSPIISLFYICMHTVCILYPWNWILSKWRKRVAHRLWWCGTMGPLTNTLSWWWRAAAGGAKWSPLRGWNNKVSRWNEEIRDFQPNDDDDDDGVDNEGRGKMKGDDDESRRSRDRIGGKRDGGMTAVRTPARLASLDSSAQSAIWFNSIHSDLQIPERK